MTAPRTNAPPPPSPDGPDTPLHEVVFCAVDLETTGGSPRTSEIVEIGAVKTRGGERLGTFQAFVRPRGSLPVDVQRLTGIRPFMVADAPTLSGVLPALLEFAGRSVFVAHNARFDWSFLAAACDVLDYEGLRPAVVDTAGLSRWLLRGDVPDHRLATLAAFLRTANAPRHRAFPDAAACLDVLHELLERAAAYGVHTLGELLSLQSPSSSRHLEKTRMARGLPRGPGVYLLSNRMGDVLYVGRAEDLRSCVRSHFLSPQGRRLAGLVAEAASVRAVPCSSDGEASALEARLIERHAPRYNRSGTRRPGPGRTRRPPREIVPGRVFGTEPRKISTDNRVDCVAYGSAELTGDSGQLGRSVAVRGQA